MYAGWGVSTKDKTVKGEPMSIGGQRFERGVGTHASSRMFVDLGGGSERFQAMVGADDSAGGNVEFRIFVDGKPVWRSGVMKKGDVAKPADVNLKGAQKLLLLVDQTEDGKSSDYANWAEARFEVTGALPKAMDGPGGTRYIVTPKPGPMPRINGPKVYGCRPGSPFLYRIPATGTRPLQFAAENLPQGLTLDAKTGIITGAVARAGKYTVKLRAANGSGKAERELEIVSGDRLALTPPMGWNHWYIHEFRVTDPIIRQAADILVSSGLADAGYSYVNIDGCWTNVPPDSPKRNRHTDPMQHGPARDESGNLLPNKHFPDMKALVDYIHAKGLKAGLYSSPGPYDCAGFAASWQHEAQDARQFAGWGFDFLKYDWCSYGQVAPPATLADRQRPYRLMGNLLKEQKRDIVFNLCQYGSGKVWEWGKEVGGQSWRTGGDLSFWIHEFYEVALENAKLRAYNGPGSWNDPDYIMTGYISDWRNDSKPYPAPFTPDEEYAFVSLWSLLASPMIISIDLTKLDDFTVNLLSNTEVIEVNQDPLGQSGRVVPLGGETFAMVKDLEDGSKAVGIFNRGYLPGKLQVQWQDLGISGRQKVRDLWRQKDLETDGTSIMATLPERGVLMLRLRPQNGRPGA